MQTENTKPQKRGAKWLDPDSGTAVTPDDKSRILQQAMSRNALFNPKIGRPYKYEPEEVMKRVIEYFEDCYSNSSHPTKTALANYLDIAYDTLLMWERDPQKPFHDTITRAVMLIRDYEETASLENKMNVILSIFRAKSLWGYIEKQQIELSQFQPDPLGEPLTEVEQQALIEKYQASIPEPIEE